MGDSTPMRISFFSLFTLAAVLLLSIPSDAAPMASESADAVVPETAFEQAAELSEAAPTKEKVEQLKAAKNKAEENADVAKGYANALKKLAKKAEDHAEQKERHDVKKASQVATKQREEKKTAGSIEEEKEGKKGTKGGKKGGKGKGKSKGK